MIVETAITIRQGLEDSRFGVNFQLQDLDVYPDHGRPRDVEAFWDPYTHDGIAQGNLGSSRPLILVSQPRPFLIQGEVRSSIVDTDVGGMEIAAAYVTETSTLKTPASLREVGYTLRAMQRAMRTFFGPTYEDDRVVNNIQVRDLLEVNLVAVDAPFEGVEDVRVAGVMFLRLGIRDVEPT